MRDVKDGTVSESELNDKSLHDSSAVCSSFSPTVSVRVRRGREWWARGGGRGGRGQNGDLLPATYRYVKELGSLLSVTFVSPCPVTPL